MRKLARPKSVRLIFSIAAIFLLSNSSVADRRTPAKMINQATCLNPQPRTADTSRNRGANFTPWANLDAKQKALLLDFFGPAEAEQAYLDLTVKQDGKAETFLAVTNALKLTQVSLDNDVNFSALDLVSAIREVRTDRLILMLDKNRVSRWRKAGGKYVIALNRNQSESSRVKFAAHTLPSGGLHCGYDLNWYTKANKTPHLHWNMRFSDGQADVHLDGYPAYIFGIIPNPIHLTYQNSDVRYWLNKYLKKYGTAGFSISKK